MRPATARTTIHDLLDASRSGLARLEPAEAARAVASGDAVLVDVRSDADRASEGVIPGAHWHPRNVLEWRIDPASEAHDPQRSGDLDRRIIVVCNEGYQSSLAAATLQTLGFHRATDLIGGFRAWRTAGLPVQRSEASSGAEGPVRRTAPPRSPTPRPTGS
jgi:rhodanese-related sulfurtransferase